MAQQVPQQMSGTLPAQQMSSVQSMPGAQQQSMTPTIVLHGFGQGGVPIQLSDLQALSALQNQLQMATQPTGQAQLQVQPPPAQAQQPPPQQLGPPMQPHMHPGPAPPHGPHVTQAVHVPGPAPPPHDPNEVRTIFISGFPDDVKERELNNLLRFLPGYEAAQLTWRPLAKTNRKQANGFALFETANYARAALPKIHNLGFDDEHSLRAEFAKKNLYVRDDRSGTTSARNGGFEPFRKKHRRDENADNPPNTTLFVGNLSSEVDSGEVKAFFSKFKGFQNIVINHMPKGTMCFVAYLDQADADVVYQTQQNVILESNGGRGLRIQYARNSLRKQQGDDISPKPGSNAPFHATISPALSTPQSSPAVMGGDQLLGLPSHG